MHFSCAWNRDFVRCVLDIAVTSRQKNYLRVVSALSASFEQILGNIATNANGCMGFILDLAPLNWLLMVERTLKRAYQTNAERARRLINGRQRLYREHRGYGTAAVMSTCTSERRQLGASEPFRQSRSTSCVLRMDAGTGDSANADELLGVDNKQGYKIRQRAEHIEDSADAED